MKKISVVVPIYNTAPYLNQCIDSILAQTHENIEIILVNNGSTDESCLICDEYKKQDSRIKVIHQENRFAVGARNSGILAATGDYIGYVDSDDWIEPTMYEEMLSVLEKNQEIDFVSVGFWNVFETHRTIGRNGGTGIYLSGEEDYLYSLFLGGNIKVGPNIWNKLFRVKVAKEHHVLPEYIRIIEDACCVFGCIPYISGYQVLEKGFYHYRQRSDSIINTTPIFSDEIISHGTKYFSGKLKDHPQKDYLMKEFQGFYMSWFGRWIVKEGPFHLDKTVSQSNDLRQKIIYVDAYSSFLHPQSVVLYGFGDVGKSYYHQLQEQDTVKLVAIVDQGKAGDMVGEQEILPPDQLKNLDFDRIVLCIYEENLAKTLKRKLEEEYQIPMEKICWAKPQKWRDMLIEEIEGTI